MAKKWDNGYGKPVCSESGRSKRSSTKDSSARAPQRRRAFDDDAAGAPPPSRPPPPQRAAAPRAKAAAKGDSPAKGKAAALAGAAGAKGQAWCAEPRSAAASSGLSKTEAKEAMAAKEKFSRFNGVYWYEPSKRWVARIKRDGKSTFLGYFDDEEEAACKVDETAAALGRLPNLHAKAAYVQTDGDATPAKAAASRPGVSSSSHEAQSRKRRVESPGDVRHTLPHAATAQQEGSGDGMGGADALIGTSAAPFAAELAAAAAVGTNPSEADAAKEFTKVRRSTVGSNSDTATSLPSSGIGGITAAAAAVPSAASASAAVAGGKGLSPASVAAWATPASAAPAANECSAKRHKGEGTGSSFEPGIMSGGEEGGVASDGGY